MRVTGILLVIIGSAILGWELRDGRERYMPSGFGGIVIGVGILFIYSK